MSVGIVILPILILLALAIGVLIYYICYKIRINRTLKGEESGAHVPMASMETVWKIVAVIAVLVMYSSLNSKIVNLQSELNNTRNALSNKINGLQYELHEMQENAKKEASMVNAVFYDFGEIDTKEHTAKMTFGVVPKSYSPETEVSLKFGGETIALTNDGKGNFTGSKSVSIFDEISEDGMICFTEGGVTKTEVWEEVPKRNLFFECIPQLGVMDSSFEIKNKNGKIKVEGELHMMSSEKNVDFFHNLTLCVWKGNTVIEELAIEDGHIVIDKSYSGEEEDGIELVVKGVDEYGYTHEMLVGGWIAGETSSVVRHGFEKYGYQVYTPDGTAMIR